MSDQKDKELVVRWHGRVEAACGGSGTAEVPLASVFMADRRFSGSTELFLLVDTELSEFWVVLSAKTSDRNPIGYARFVDCKADEVILGGVVKTFGLQEVQSASFPCPHPIISLSGVLRTRRAALEADQAISAYQTKEDQMMQCDQR